MRLLRVRDVSERLQCSDELVYRLIRTGALASVRIGLGRGSRHRIPEQSLNEYLHRDTDVAQPGARKPQKRTVLTSAERLGIADLYR